MKKKLIKLKYDSNVWIAAGSVLLVAVMVLPMMYISRYVWPSVDDYELSLWTKKAFLETGSLWEVLKQAGAYVIYKYFGWQGSFSSILLMALQPGIFGDEYYWIGVILIIVSLLAGVYLLTYVLMVKQAKTSKSIWLILTSLPFWAWLLRLMYTEEAFYWWTGASYYTGFHSWAMLMTAVAICIYTDWDKYGRCRRIASYILGGAVCVFLGGGNFATALMFVLVLSGLLLGAIISHKKSVGVLGVYTLCTLAALILAVVAPGNSAHMNNDFQQDISAVEAIFISIRDGLQYIRSWTNISVVMLFVFLLPFIWRLTRDCSLSFRLPVLATILSGGLYLAEYAPTSYTFGGYAPGRLVNLYYLNYYGLLLFNVFYWIGWLDRKTKGLVKVGKIADNQHKWQPFYIGIVGVLFLLSISVIGIKNTNFYRIYGELNAEIHKKADSFLSQRVDYFAEHQGEDVIVEKLPYKSEITYFGDLYPDQEHIVNSTMAEYYGVNSISLKEN